MRIDEVFGHKTPFVLELTVWKCLGSLFAIFFLYVTGRLLIFWRSFHQKLQNRLPVPGPEPNFPLGNANLLKEFGILDGWAKAAEFGDKEQGIGSFWGLDTQFIVFLHWEHLKKMFAISPHHDQLGAIDFGNVDSNPTQYWIGEKSVIYTDASRHHEWVKTRRLVGKAFLTTSIRPMAPRMTKQVLRLISYLQKHTSSTNGPIDMKKCIYAVSMDILGVTAFGRDFKGVSSLETETKNPMLESFQHLLHVSESRQFEKMAVMPWLKPKYIWVPTPGNLKFKHHASIIKRELTRFVRERKREMQHGDKGEYSDFLNFMLLAQDDSGDSLSDDQLRDNLATVLFAGHDTTATNLTYALYCIAANQDVQKRLQKEVDDVVGDNDDLTHEIIQKLEYTQLVVRETLRLYPPVHGTVRSLSKDEEIGGYSLKMGTLVYIPIWSIQRDPHNWKDPLKFDPERHREENNPPFYGFVAFAGGQRNCIGQRFAGMAASIQLALLVRHFHFTLPEDYVMEPVAIGPMQEPKRGLPLIVSPRK